MTDRRRPHRSVRLAVVGALEAPTTARVRHSQLGQTVRTRLGVGTRRERLRRCGCGGKGLRDDFHGGGVVGSRAPSPTQPPRRPPRRSANQRLSSRGGARTGRRPHLPGRAQRWRAPCAPTSEAPHVGALPPVQHAMGPSAGLVETWNDVIDASLPFVTFRTTIVFLADDTVLTSTSTLRFRTSDEVGRSLERAGVRVRDLRDAPIVPARSTSSSPSARSERGEDQAGGARRLAPHRLQSSGGDRTAAPDRPDRRGLLHAAPGVGRGPMPSAKLGRAGGPSRR